VRDEETGRRDVGFAQPAREARQNVAATETVMRANVPTAIRYFYSWSKFVSSSTKLFGVTKKKRRRAVRNNL
jgi:hypothetical protein